MISKLLNQLRKQIIESPALYVALLMMIILTVSFWMRLSEQRAIDSFCKLKGVDGGMVYGRIDQPTCYERHWGLASPTWQLDPITTYDIDPVEWKNYLKEYYRHPIDNYGGKI